MTKNTLLRSFLALGLIAGLGAGSLGISGANPASAESGKEKDSLFFSLRAKAEIEDEDSDSRFEARGRYENKPFANGLVTAVGSSTVTMRVGNTLVTVDASKSSVIGKNGATTTLSSVAVGDMIFVKGSITGTTTVAASSISIGRPEKGMPVKKPLGIKGTVTAVATTSLTMREDGKIFTVDATNASVTGKSGATTTLSSIKVGDKVFVQGSLTGTTTIAATAISFGEKSKDIKPARKSFKEFWKNFFERMRDGGDDRREKGNGND